MAEFVQITSLLNDKDLSAPTLDILNQDAHLYRALFYQCGNDVEFTSTYVRAANRDSANAKFSKLFDFARTEQPELVLTPEYSCPWSIVEKLIKSRCFPSKNKLWIIGCESISAREIKNVIEQSKEVAWLFENELVDANVNNDHFFNPVLSIFETTSLKENKAVMVIVVQFKTFQMGGTPWETENLIRGNNVYVLENRAESTKAIILICSDSMNPGIKLSDLPNYLNFPYLIIHLQFNALPNHDIFCRYRGDVYVGGRTTKEIICLNWGHKVRKNGANANLYGGSALYTKSSDLNLADQRIDANHKFGLYYTAWKRKHAHVFYFNYDEHVFLLRTTKPSQEESPPPQQRRTGPEMLDVKSWSSQISDWQSLSAIDDGFSDLCTGIDPVHFESLSNYKPSDIERLLALSTGHAIAMGWYHPSENPFFEVTDQELVRRFTVTQTPVESIRTERRTNLVKYLVLASEIVSNPDLFPLVLEDLKSNCAIKYRPEQFRESFDYNLYPVGSEGPPATGVYAGETDHQTASFVYDRTTTALAGSQNSSRIVVWYRFGNQILHVKHDSKPSVSSNPGNARNSITSVRK